MMTSGLKIRRRFFAAFNLNVVADLLAFVEALQARALHGANMDKYVLTALASSSPRIIAQEPEPSASSAAGLHSGWSSGSRGPFANAPSSPRFREGVLPRPFAIRR